MSRETIIRDFTDAPGVDSGTTMWLANLAMVATVVVNRADDHDIREFSARVLATDH